MATPEEVQVPYTIEIQGVVGVAEGDFEDVYAFQEHLEKTVDLKFEKVELYAPDHVEVTYTDWPWGEGDA